MKPFNTDRFGVDWPQAERIQPMDLETRAAIGIRRVSLGLVLLLSGAVIGTLIGTAAAEYAQAERAIAVASAQAAEGGSALEQPVAP